MRPFRGYCKKIELSKHALEEIDRRGISADIVESVLQKPQQIVDEYGNKRAYQSIMNIGEKDYLVRVIVNHSVEPAKVVTIYRTSKISKYWRPQ